MIFFSRNVRTLGARTRSIALAILALVGVCAASTHLAYAQTTPASSATGTLGAVGSATVMGAPRWLELNPTQRRSLQPLAGTWDTLSDGHRRKWIALAQNYPSLAPPEQEKLHARMVEWAALKPKEREQARLNFAQTKKLAPGERAANWDAYQALSAEEREKLASGAQRKPVGAAVAVKPVAPTRLTVVPITPKTPETKQILVPKPQTLNRNTLLPMPATSANDNSKP